MRFSGSLVAELAVLSVVVVLLFLDVEKPAQTWEPNFQLLRSRPFLPQSTVVPGCTNSTNSTSLTYGSLCSSISSLSSCCTSTPESGIPNVATVCDSRCQKIFLSYWCSASCIASGSFCIDPTYWTNVTTICPCLVSGSFLPTIINTTGTNCFTYLPEVSDPKLAPVFNSTPSWTTTTTLSRSGIATWGLTVLVTVDQAPTVTTIVLTLGNGRTVTPIVTLDKWTYVSANLYSLTLSNIVINGLQAIDITDSTTTVTMTVECSNAVGSTGTNTQSATLTLTGTSPTFVSYLECIYMSFVFPSSSFQITAMNGTHCQIKLGLLVEKTWLWGLCKFASLSSSGWVRLMTGSRLSVDTADLKELIVDGEATLYQIGTAISTITTLTILEGSTLSFASGQVSVAVVFNGCGTRNAGSRFRILSGLHRLGTSMSCKRPIFITGSTGRYISGSSKKFNELAIPTTSTTLSCSCGSTCGDDTITVESGTRLTIDDGCGSSAVTSTAGIIVVGYLTFTSLSASGSSTFATTGNVTVNGGTVEFVINSGSSSFTSLAVFSYTYVSGATECTSAGIASKVTVYNCDGTCTVTPVLSSSTCTVYLTYVSSATTSTGTGTGTSAATTTTTTTTTSTGSSSSNSDQGLYGLFALLVVPALLIAAIALCFIKFKNSSNTDAMVKEPLDMPSQNQSAPMQTPYVTPGVTPYSTPAAYTPVANFQYQ